MGENKISNSVEGKPTMFVWEAKFQGRGYCATPADTTGVTQ